MKHFNFISGKNIPIAIKKIFFLSIVFVLGCNSLYSQQCKLERLKDDFSSSQTVYSKEVTLASVFPLIGSKKPWDLVMKFMMIDSTVNIFVTHKSQSYSSKIDDINFKFKDGTIIQKDAFSTSEYNTGLGYSYTSTSFILTKDELIKFGTVDLIKFRADLKYNRDYPLVEEEIKQKSIDKIRKDAACMLDELNSAPNAKKEDKKEIKDVAEYKCSYEIDKIDGFTKKRSMLTNAAPFFDSKVSGGHIFFQVNGSNINGANGLKFYLCHNYEAVKQADESAKKSKMLFDQVEILLENDESFSIKSNEVTALFQQAVNSVWSIQLFTIENDSEWQKLKTVPLKSLRLSMNGKILFTQDIDKKYSKSFMNVINCVDALGIPKSK